MTFARQKAVRHTSSIPTVTGSLTFVFYLAIIDCLKAFARAAEATFGHRLSSNYEEAIEQFGVNFTRVMPQFQISMTTKVHILLHHVPHFIRLTGMPLGLFQNK